MPHCRTDVQGLTWEEGPAGRLPGLPPLHRAAGTCRPAAGRRPHHRDQNAIKTNFIYIQVPTARQEGGRGPVAPQPGRSGTKL